MTIRIKMFTRKSTEDDVDFEYRINRYIKDLDDEPEKIEFVIHGKERNLTCIITHMEKR